MSTLKYPLYHFDFETFDTAIPIYDKSSPYQKIPFQYSLHIQDKNGKITEHFEYLAKGDKDPRIELPNKLKNEIGKIGSIVTYNQSFEINVFKKLAEDFPEHEVWINNVLNRIVDLGTPFKNYHYYNPKQQGKWSIKKVLPSLSDKSYSDLGINNGGDASMQYFYSHIRDKLDNKQEIREDLLKYCALDTKSMVIILNKLMSLV